LDILAKAAADAVPVAPQLQTDLIEPIVEAIALTLTEMAETEVVALGSFHRKDSALLGDISSLVRMAGTDRTLVLSFPTETGKALAARILTRAEMKSDDDLMRDCLGEVTNVVAGQVKALLSGSAYKFSLTTPQVVSGPSHGRALGADNLALIFGCDLGQFAVQLYPAH
jgi:chemotaxis protein CheX